MWNFIKLLFSKAGKILVYLCQKSPLDDVLFKHIRIHWDYICNRIDNWFLEKYIKLHDWLTEPISEGAINAFIDAFGSWPS
jgi:hypothetical protein